MKLQEVLFDWLNRVGKQKFTSKQDKIMITQNALNAHEIRELMQETVQEHLSIGVSGYKSNTEMIFDVLMKAASEGISIDAACRDLENTVGANTIRALLNQQLPKEELVAQEKAMNAALAARLPE